MNRRIAAARGAFVALLVVIIAGAGINFSRFRGADAEPTLRLVLNVPAHRLYVYEQGELTRTFRVSVGMRGYQTPAGSYGINSVIWNPWWHPPNSAWARGRKPEPPGETNPMGRVKLNFAPLLYIHGTVERGQIGDPASHGCVRMMNEDLIELTRIVHRHTTPNVTESTLDALAAAPTQTKTFNLQRRVPFDVVYSVAAVKDGFLFIYPDVYQRVKDYQKRVTEALVAGGIDPDRVNWTRLEELMQKGRRTKVAIAVDELLGVGDYSQDGSSERH